MAEDMSLGLSTGSPRMRSVSPSPSITPSMAIGACPDLDRSVSDSSTIFSLASSRSVSSNSEGGRRRGYVRPQGTLFSDSAKNRDSVMSLGSIAHMQYYFARTGLLDGKGAQLARKAKDKHDTNIHNIRIVGDDMPWDSEDKENHDSESGSPNASPTGSPTLNEHSSPAMLPPTVSTYRTKVITSQPPPDIRQLRHDLKASLDKAGEIMRNIPTISHPSSPSRPASDDKTPPSPSNNSTGENQGWYEIQGLTVLDAVTLAIRSAKDYYTFHSHPHILYSIQSESKIRADLYQVLDILKRMANRDFKGGVRQSEQEGILEWIDGILDLLRKETKLEHETATLRSQRQWLQGDWSGREHEREWSFLTTFDTNTTDPLPVWNEPSSSEPTQFLRAMSSGLRLIQLHNELVKQSTRRFGEIKSFYTDLGKPYRCADNLRYWVKAAELRWEVHLQFDVLDVVYDRGQDTWSRFDTAILTWSQAVRKELSDEWLANVPTEESLDVVLES